MDAKLESYVRAGEGMNLEFKRCGGKVERDVYETICSFANRQGGSILLGVLDDGTVSGVSPKAVASIERNIVNVANDPSMFNVAPALEFERLEGDGGKTVIRVWVPMGPALGLLQGDDLRQGSRRRRQSEDRGPTRSDDHQEIELLHGEDGLPLGYRGRLGP